MEMELKQIVNTVWRWRIVILSIFGVTVIALGIAVMRIDPTYKAYVEMQITAPSTEDVNLFGSTRSASEREAITIARNNFTVVAESDFVRNATIALLELSKDDGEYELEIVPVQDADFVYVEVTSRSPEMAAEIANHHVDIAIERMGNLRALPAETTLNELEMELQEAAIDLSDAEIALSAFQDQNDLTTSLQNELEAQEQRYQRLILDRNEILISDPLTANNDIEPIVELLVEREAELTPLLETRKQYNNLLFQLDKAQDNYEETAASFSGVDLSQTLPPALQAAKNSLDDAQQALESFLLENDVATLESDILLLQKLIEQLQLERDRRLILTTDVLQTSRVLTIDGLIDDSRQRIEILSALEPQYNLLTIQIERAREDYNFILQKYKQAEILTNSSKTADFIQVIALAFPPEESSSSPLMLLVLGVAGSLGFGIFLAFILEYFSGSPVPTVETEPQIATDPTPAPAAPYAVEEQDSYHSPPRLKRGTAQGD